MSMGRGVRSVIRAEWVMLSCLLSSNTHDPGKQARLLRIISSSILPYGAKGSLQYCFSCFLILHHLTHHTVQRRAIRIIDVTQGIRVSFFQTTA